MEAFTRHGPRAVRLLLLLSALFTASAALSDTKPSATRGLVYEETFGYAPEWGVAYYPANGKGPKGSKKKDGKKKSGTASKSGCECYDELGKGKGNKGKKDKRIGWRLHVPATYDTYILCSPPPDRISRSPR